MNILIATARNIRYLFMDEKKHLDPEIEAVLTVYSKHVDFVGAGLTKIERCETIRFAMSPESARNFAKELVSWADEAEKHKWKEVIE